MEAVQVRVANLEIDNKKFIIWILVLSAIFIHSIVDAKYVAKYRVPSIELHGTDIVIASKQIKECNHVDTSDNKSCVTYWLSDENGSYNVTKFEYIHTNIGDKHTVYNKNSFVYGEYHTWSKVYWYIRLSLYFMFGSITYSLLTHGRSTK